FWSMVYPLTFYAVQVSGGLIEHAANDSILFLDTPEDPAIAVTSTVVGGNPALSGDARGAAVVPADCGLDSLAQDWFSSCGMGYFNFSDAYLAYGFSDFAHDEWLYVCNRVREGNNQFLFSLMIGFAGGVTMAIAPATGPIDALLIRKALIQGAIGM